MYQLKFYASKREHYHNKYFSFFLKSEDEIGNILLAFVSNHNVFYAIYLLNHENNRNDRLTRLEISTIVKDAAIRKGFSKADIANLSLCFYG